MASTTHHLEMWTFLNKFFYFFSTYKNNQDLRLVIFVPNKLILKPFFPPLFWLSLKNTQFSKTKNRKVCTYFWCCSLKCTFPDKVGEMIDLGHEKFNAEPTK